MNRLKKLMKKQWFTLVELIIVIAIIAVLAVAAFMVLTKWLGKSRDSRRIWDLGTIKKALEITYSDTDNKISQYPEPTNSTWVLDTENNTMWNLWVFGLDTITDMDNMQKAPQDPSDQSYYKYATTLENREFQVWTLLEDGSEVSIIANVMAGNQVARVDGNYDGYTNYLSGANRMIVRTPSLLVYEGNSVWDLSGSNEMFMVEGQALWTPMTIRSYEIVGDSPDVDEVATALGLDSGMASVVLKNEAGVVVESESWWETPTETPTETDADTVLLLHGEAFTDSSDTPHIINENGAVAINTTTKQIGAGSMYFDGASDYLNLADSSDRAFGAGDFTIDFWVNFETYTDFVGILSTGDDFFSSNGMRIEMGTAWLFLVNGYQNMILIDENLLGLSTNTWYHIAIVRNGNTLSSYKNGLLSKATTFSDSIIDSTNNLFIGKFSPDSADYMFNWYLDEFRISKWVARWDSTNCQTDVQWSCFAEPTSAY